MMTLLSGKIVFSSGHFGDYDIFLLDLDTKTLKQLTSGDCWNDYPRLSPDKTRIAFTSNRSGKPEIWVMAIDGANPKPLTPNLKTSDQPSWSPDGKRMAFVSNEYFNQDIFIVDVAGGTPIRLTKGDGFDGYPDWSPDGKSIAFCSERNLNQDIFIIDVETGKERRVTNHSAPDTSPAWSPDGRKLAFVSERPDDPRKFRFLKGLGEFFYGDEDLDVWVWDFEKKDLRQMTTGKGADRNVRWSPDGRSLIFTNSSAEKSDARILLVDYETGEIRPLGVNRDELNAELQKNIDMPVLTKAHKVVDDLTPEAVDEFFRKVGKRALDKVYYSTERYIDWR